MNTYLPFEKHRTPNVMFGGSLNNDYVIAIPSYNRVDRLKTQTLPMLDSYNIPHSKIYIFTANNKEFDLYKSSINSNYKFVKGVIKLHNQRNFISKYFKEGQRIVYIDDDIRQITKLGNKKLVRLPNLNSLILKGFDTCYKNNLYFWGVYPVDNHFFMSNKISLDLKFVPGGFFGIINRHDKDLLLTLNEKEDYERTLLFFKKDGGVVRFNYIGFKTKNYAVGGMSGNPKIRLDESKKNVKILKQRYPDNVRIIEPTEESTHWELRLKGK